MKMLMPQQRHQQWQNILQITEQLRQLSADENWLAMTELESERHTKLEDFFSTPVSDAEAEEVALGIRQMLESDKQLIQMGQLQQKEMSDGVQKINTGKRAIKAYSHFQK